MYAITGAIVRMALAVVRWITPREPSIGDTYREAFGHALRQGLTMDRAHMWAVRSCKLAWQGIEVDA